MVPCSGKALSGHAHRTGGSTHRPRSVADRSAQRQPGQSYRGSGHDPGRHPHILTVLPRPRRTPHRTRRSGRPRHHLPLGPAVHAAAGRRRPAQPPPRRQSLAGRRDLCEGRRPVAVCLPGHRPVRPGHRRSCVDTARCQGSPPVLPVGHWHCQGDAGRGRHRPGAGVSVGAGGAAAGGLALHPSSTPTTGSRPTMAG
jgi:hypothetical protein